MSPPLIRLNLCLTNQQLRFALLKQLALDINQNEDSLDIRISGWIWPHAIMYYMIIKPITDMKKTDYALEVFEEATVRKFQWE